ncbi:MAG: hypothetical protein ABIR29_11765, partial [Chthoniobacterales bacterium]
KRSARKKPRESEETTDTRSKRARVATEPAARAATSPPPSPAPTPVRENIGEKVRNFLLYPFKRPLLTPTPVSAKAAQPAAAKASPTPSVGRRRSN